MIGLLLLLALAVWRYRETGLTSAFTTNFPSDLKVYVLGGDQVSAGQPLYAGDLLPRLPFTYPPFAGVVFSWLTESEALGVAWKAASVLVLWLVVRASTARHALLLTAVFVLWLSPVQGTLYFGQINLLLMGLVCLDFLPRVRLPGIGVGLAAGLKLTPRVLRAPAHPAAPVGRGVHRRVYLPVHRGRGVCGGRGRQALLGGRHLLHRSGRRRRQPGSAVHPAGPGTRRRRLHSAVAACGRRGDRACAARFTTSSRPLAVSFIGMTACLVSPFSWFHHWVWVVPMLAWVYTRWGPIVLALFLVPYAATNISSGLVQVPDLLFILVPVGFMLWYAQRPSPSRP